MHGTEKMHDRPAPLLKAQPTMDDADNRSIGAEARANWRLAARIVLFGALLSGGVFVLANYLHALLWALVLAIALTPAFRRLAERTPERLRKAALPALFALVVSFAFVLPIGLLTIEAGREAHNVFEYARGAEQNGVPVPDFVSHLPLSVAGPLDAWWNANLAHSGWIKEFAERLDTSSNRALGRSIGRTALHRIVQFSFAMLALFFLLRDADAFARQCRAVSHRLVGDHGERIGQQMIASVHGTVNGLVFVGIGEGIVLGIAYAIAGVPHPILFGAFTAFAAMIPFAAAVAIVSAALTLLLTGHVGSAVAIIAVGFITIFTADHFLRPVLIGGSTKLPFLWVLLGILGGVEGFGLVGLFIGPAIMAACVMLWRDIASGRIDDRSVGDSRT